MPRCRDVRIDVADLTLTAAGDDISPLGSLAGVYLVVLWRHRH